VPIGAVWIDGDIDMSSLGTLTLVDGDRVVAFGHPMLGTGETDFPLAVGRVEAVVPSARQSFRLTSLGPVVGRLTQDRDSAIVGRLGASAPMFPCTVRVRGVRNRTFRYRIAGYWQMAPLLAYYATALSAARWEGESNLYTVQARVRIALKGLEEPVELQNVYAALSPAEPAFELVWAPLSVLTLNPFREVELSGLEVDLEVERGMRAATIEAVRCARRTVRPGERLELEVLLREFQGQEHLRKVELEVPEDARPGTTAQVMVCDALTSLTWQMSVDPDFFSPRDFDGLLRTIRRIPDGTRLYVHTSVLRKGLRYKGVAMPALPDSVINMLSQGTEAGLAAPLEQDVQASVETPWVLSGSQVVSVLIKRGGDTDSLSY